MSTTAGYDKDLITRVRELARTRQHRIAARQLAALDTQSEASLLAMEGYLMGRPERDPVPGPVSPAAAVAHATECAGLAARPAQPAQPGRRPGAKVTEEGIYYYRQRVYKVIKSQYSGHWQARRLDVRTDPGTGKVTGSFTYAEGMMGVLRAEDRMTAAQSREFEELYGYPTCTDCGRPLENDLSRRRRIGPVCWDKNGHTDAELED